MKKEYLIGMIPFIGFLIAIVVSNDNYLKQLNSPFYVGYQLMCIMWVAAIITILTS